MNLKALRTGCASRGVEVSCKQHRSSAKESQATLCSEKNLCKNNTVFLVPVTKNLMYIKSIIRFFA